jgi:hypothetical protein
MLHLKVKCLTAAVKTVVGDVEEQDQVWEMLYTCHSHPEKYIAEVLEPIVKFHRYKVHEHASISEFYYFLKAAMIGTKGV